MPRALLAVWLDVPGDGRPGAVAEWAERRARLESEGCHFWVFESSARPGRYLEFTEASDVGALREARARAGMADASEHLYLQVELS